MLTTKCTGCGPYFCLATKITCIINTLVDLQMGVAERMVGVATEQYGSRKYHSVYIQALITGLLYDLVRWDSTPATIKFIDLVTNYDLIVRRISSMYLQLFSKVKSPIFCTFTTLQDMVHT